MQFTPVIEESMVMDASPEAVWTLLADLRRMSRWSPAVLRVRVTTPGEPGLGTRTRNLNRMGLLLWPTSAEVVAWSPGHELAFRIRENRSVWRYTLIEEEPGRTMVTHRRETPEGISPRALELEQRLFGSVDGFEAKVRDGMRKTLRNLRRSAESA